MNILVIGSGGREHAIVKCVNKSKLVDKLYCLSGNYGIGLDCEIVDIKIDDLSNILKFVKEKKIDLVIVGPEDALFAGVVDLLEEHGIKVFGPSKKASMIEASKEYAKKIMDKYDIATAKYERFDDYDKACNYIKEKSEYPIVIKYDGLAAGKGVFIVNDELEAKEVLCDLLVKRVLGDDCLIIEDFLDGDEFTILSLVKDDKVYPFQAARDFKRVYDNDEGLNTGGMGAICPYIKVDDKAYQQAIDILNKAASALVKEHNNFKGVLYGGFINTKDGVKVIEFNARFGDPETECVLNNLESDLVQCILDILDDKEITLVFKKAVSVGLVLSAKGYPQSYEKDVELDEYLELPFDILHMQTKIIDNKVVSNGGRVLFILNEASTSQEGFDKIYTSLNEIKEHKLHFRSDLSNY